MRGHSNRRHRRSGHLFQNRYKSVVCEEEPYFLELVRYLHLNPLRAKVVPDLLALAQYPYSGHATLLGAWPRPWQETREGLGRFSPQVTRARERYQTFVADGMVQGRRPDLQGGGLVRSVGGWTAVRELRQGRERYTSDERILGRSEFVEHVRREQKAQDAQAQGQRQGRTLEGVIEQVCQVVGVRAEEVAGGSRRRVVSRARAGIAYLWLAWLGHSGPAAAQLLSLRPATIYEAARRGRQESGYWQQVLTNPKSQ